MNVEKSVWITRDIKGPSFAVWTGKNPPRWDDEASIWRSFDPMADVEDLADLVMYLPYHGTHMLFRYDEIPESFNIDGGKNSIVRLAVSIKSL